MIHASTSINTPVPYVNTQHQVSPPTLLSVRQFAERNIGFSQGSIRSLIFNAKSRQSSTGEIPGNGLEFALVRIGRKILVNEAKFHEWLENQSS